MAASNLRSISSPTTAEERAVRVEDYLNDKLQTFADLENLDGLLKSVQNQQILLHKQVSSPLLVARNMSKRDSCPTRSLYMSNRRASKLLISMSISSELKLSRDSRPASIDVS